MPIDTGPYTAIAGTTSRIKMDAIRKGFAMHGVDINLTGSKPPSGVSDQPTTFKSITKGARNRERGARAIQPKATFAIGIESGLVGFGMDQNDFVCDAIARENELWFDPACVVITRKIGEKKKGDELETVLEEGLAWSAMLPVPLWIVRETLNQKTELGHVVQKLANGGEKDPHIWFSDSHADREAIIAQAVALALCPILYQADRYTAPSWHVDPGRGPFPKRLA